MALQLVVTDEAGRLHVPEEAKAVLDAITEPVAIVAVAGPYRSGKSFLLNCLSDLDSPRSDADEGNRSLPGFAVGSTTNACTRGLWLRASPSPIRGPNGKQRVLWVDSEGLGAVGCDQQHDLHVFSLAVLLSSVFVFNSRGAIDEASIAALSFITQLAKNIHVNVSGASEDPEEFCQVFPPFLWILRDFALQLKSKTGAAMTERQYLEESLKREIGFDEAVTARNRIRMMLTAFFRQRDCVGLQRPVIDEAALAQLGSSDRPCHALLRPGFVQQLEQLRSKIEAMLQPKMLQGASLNGPMFSTLLNEYVRAINAGQVPTIERGWKAVLTLQSQKALTNSLDAFSSMLLAAANATRDDAGEVPLSQKAVDRLHEEACTTARKRMAADSLQIEPATTAALEAGMAERWTAFESVNRREWNVRGKAELASMWSPVKHSLASKSSSWGEMQQAWRAVQAEFRAGIGDGTVDADAVVNEFAAKVILHDAGALLSDKLASADQELVECRAQVSRGEAALSAAVAAHAQTMASSSSSGFAQEQALQDKVAELTGALRIAETALVAQKAENDAEMVELRLRSEFRDKEVARLNQVIERLQEKTHAHVTAMNKELRASNEKCAAQSERLAIMGERLRVAESALAVNALVEQRASQPHSLSLRNSPAGQLPTTEAHAFEAITTEEGANRAMKELRQARTRSAALEAENQAVRGSSKKAVTAPVRNIDANGEYLDDDLEGSPKPGELVV